MVAYRRPLGLYPLFQIPVILFAMFLATALLFWLLGVGKPKVAVAIALDLSSSTYGLQFNAPGSIMAQEIEAVKAYLDKNASGILRQPNQVRVFGFASGIESLTTSFTDNADISKQELNRNIQASLANRIGGGTNLDLAIQVTTQDLSNVSNLCRELLIVTDGQAVVSQSIINNAINNNVKINAVVMSPDDAPDIRNATFSTGGKYLFGEASNLSELFTEQFFNNVNNNWRWLVFWLGLAWIALMWTLIMPLDRWLFQGLFKMPMNLSGRLALCNALFWTVATPGIIWRLYKIFDLALPFISSC